MGRTTIDRPTILSLFTGAGGLDIGLEAAGFVTRACVESDEDARRTIASNRPSWCLTSPGDVHKLTPRQLLRAAGLRKREVTLLAGGPPCQPFSKSAYWANGKTLGVADPRAATFDAYFDIVEATLPRVLLLENVPGAISQRKEAALSLMRERLRQVNRRSGTNYQLHRLQLDAADYGVPQHRQRAFALASIDGHEFSLPPPTHGPQGGVPYLTAWDAIGDLDSSPPGAELTPTGKWAALLPSIPEGDNYLWHTPRSSGKPLFGWRTRYWSFLLKLAKNQPSWTIQADPGPATGPFHWRSRQLSVRELCRLQTFPDDYELVGNRRSLQRQIGNAVPCALGELLGLEIRRQFLGERVRRQLRMLPNRAASCPPPERRRPVPRKYLALCDAHDDHPGPGLGPGALQR